MFQRAVGAEHGLDPCEVDALAGEIRRHRATLAAMRGKELGFMDLPYDRSLAESVLQKAAELRSWCANFVVLGIGGSALGNAAIHAALQHPHHNLLPAGHPARKGAPRIFIADNVDPSGMRALADLLQEGVSQTAFNVITKSGSTAETMSQFLFFRDLLRRTGGCEPARQIIVTTDPRRESSLLRQIAEAEGYHAFPIPPNVGGRFSVLSAVGLLSAAVGGLDIRALLAGAAAMDARCRSDELPENPAALYASLLYLEYRKGKHICVLMPYSERLRALGYWYCQLWAESLGKRHGLRQKDIFGGPTPVASVGVTDQHSVMQLYQDGPFDKVITLIELDSAAAVPLPICVGEAEPELGYLARHSFDDLFHAELSATRMALCDKHRPNCTIRVPRVDERSLGELFMFFEYAAAYSGLLYGVNAYDQPGVELGKHYTIKLLGGG